MKKVEDNDAAGFFRANYRKLVRYLRYRYAEIDEMEAEDVVSDVMAEVFGDSPISLANQTFIIFQAYF